MTPVILIIFGIVVVWVTIWDIRREEADMLFWMDFLWWDVNKTENPLLYRIAVGIQLAGAFLMLAVGIVWLMFSNE